MVDDTSDTDYTERAYSTSEISKMIGIAVPTVRKYSQSLESKGYVFLKAKGTGKHQARLYLEKDVTALRYLKEIREKSNMKVEQATSVVIERLGKGSIQTVSGNDTTKLEPYNKQYGELKEIVKRQGELLHNQNEMIKRMADKLDQQDTYINNKLDKIIEDNKLLEAPTEERGFFARLFNK